MATTAPVAAVAAAKPLARPAVDELTLKCALIRFCGAEPTALDNDEIKMALERDGITQFSNHFTELTTNDIKELKFIQTVRIKSRSRRRSSIAVE